MPSSFPVVVALGLARQSHQVSDTISKATKLVATTDVKQMIP